MVSAINYEGPTHSLRTYESKNFEVSPARSYERPLQSPCTSGSFLNSIFHAHTINNCDPQASPSEYSCWFVLSDHFTRISPCSLFIVLWILKAVWVVLSETINNLKNLKKKQFYHRFMHRAPSSDHSLLTLKLTLNWFYGSLKFSMTGARMMSFSKDW